MENNDNDTRPVEETETMPEIVGSQEVFDGLGDHNKKRIVDIEDRCRKLIEGIKKNVYQLGKALSEAKKILPHGKFQTWIKEAFGNTLSYPTAHNYMLIYNRFEKRPDVVQCLPLTHLLHMAKSLPDEEIIKEIDRRMEDITSPANEGKMDKVRKESLLVLYGQKRRKMIENFKEIKRVANRVRKLPEAIGELKKSGYNDLEIFTHLKKLSDEKYIAGIDEAIQVLQAIKDAHGAALKEFGDRVAKAFLTDAGPADPNLQ